MRTPHVLAVILAGGHGSRLEPLTANRAKPSLRLAGTYRLIDVALSNLVNSGLDDVRLIEQYEPLSLNDHLAAGRPWDLDRTVRGLRLLGPFEGSEGEGFAHGNSDSLWRQHRALEADEPDLVMILSADHLYTLDFRDVIDTHLRTGADLTMVTTRLSENVSAHGVVAADDDGRVTGFWYKPDDPPTDLIATEVFCVTAPVLFEALAHLHEEKGELSDYGDDLIPYLVHENTAVEHRLDGYWIDLGTPQAYWQAHMDLLDGTGAPFDDPSWPIRSAQPQLVPGRVETSADLHESYVSPGSRVAGTVRRSVIGPGATIEEGADVSECVILDDVVVPAGARIRRCIVDHGARVKPGEWGDNDRIAVIGRSGEPASDD